MHIRKQNKVWFYIQKVVFKVISYINNENNCNFHSNGESKLLVYVKNKIFKKQDSIIFFDVGANVGAYATSVQNIFNDKKLLLHLFEPSQACINILKNTFQDAHNVVVNNFGLSDQKETKKIFYDAQTSMLASLYVRDISLQAQTLSQSEDVFVDRADTYIEHNKIPHINFLKLDVEGHELFVLKGFGTYLDNNFIDCIQFEYGGCNLDSRTTLKEITQLLEAHGFLVYKILPNSLEIFSYNALYENFRYTNYVAISKKIDL